MHPRESEENSGFCFYIVINWYKWYKRGRFSFKISRKGGEYSNYLINRLEGGS